MLELRKFLESAAPLLRWMTPWAVMNSRPERFFVVFFGGGIVSCLYILLRGSKYSAAVVV